MSKYRIVERRFYSEINEEWLNYFYVDKFHIFFWNMVKSGFNTVEAAEHWITGEIRDTEAVIKEINF